MYSTELATPIGRLRLVGSDHALTALHLPSERSVRRRDPEWRDDPEPFAEVIRQLHAYFAGNLRTFSVPLAPAGTPFQRRVWEAVLGIPYGKTASYREIAGTIGRPSAVRAVGAANGRNPIPIIIPCHRIIGSDGTLTGYGGGLDTKRFLLELEWRVAGGVEPAARRATNADFFREIQSIAHVKSAKATSAHPSGRFLRNG